MRNHLKKLRSENKTIMVSSHILPELADICNKIGIIERGKLLYNGTVTEAIKQVRGNFVFTVSVGAERNEQAAKRIETYGEVQTVKIGPQAEFMEVRLKDGHEDGSFIPERLINEGFRLKTFTEKEVNLENVFMEITKGITN
jgi:ABC-2 type transport system ATP-binding protein